MNLFLVQHGEAVDKSENPDRPLSDRGRSDVGGVAAVLTRASVSPQRIIHSGKTRARETAEMLCAALTPGHEPEPVEGIAPLDPVTEFVKTLDVESERVMVCGHQPFMGRLVSYLLTGDEESPVIEYLPGSIACLQRSDESEWTLCWFLRPELCL